MIFYNFAKEKDTDIVLKTHKWSARTNFGRHIKTRYKCLCCGLEANPMWTENKLVWEGGDESYFNSDSKSYRWGNQHAVEYLSCDEKIIKDIIE